MANGSNTNKVEFGLSNFHYGIYTVNSSTGAGVLGAQSAIAGAVELKLDSKSDEMKFFADDITYYSEFSDGGMTGEMTFALMPDEFKSAILGYKTDSTNGGLGRPVSAVNAAFYCWFEVKGDSKKRRVLLLNVVPGDVKREYKTKSDKTEIVTESLPVSVVGDTKTGIRIWVYTEGDTGYTALGSTPAIPTPASA